MTDREHKMKIKWQSAVCYLLIFHFSNQRHSSKYFVREMRVSKQKWFKWF